MTTESIDRIVETDGDGTLFDTHANIVGSMIYSVGEVLGKVVSEEDLRPYFGTAIQHFYSMMGALEHQIEECIAAHRIFQMENFHMVEAFDGAVESLYEIKRAGVPSVLVTSRAGRSLDILLERTGAGEVLDGVVTAFDVPVNKHKPDPLPFMKGLEIVSQKLKIPIPKNIFVFGDTDPDIEGGINLQKLLVGHEVQTIWAEYGQKKVDGIKHRADFTVKDVREMPGIVLGN